MNNSLPANYDEKVSCLSGEEFFDFFSRMNAEPRWVNSAGKPSIQIIGRCHHGHSHSAVFDPETRKVTCFSDCGKGMFLHTWVKQALNMDSPQEAKDFIEDWMDGQDIDFSSRDPTELDDYTYHEQPFVPEHIEPLPGIGEAATKELYSKFDTSTETLKLTKWHYQDGIDVEILQLYDVAAYVRSTKYSKQKSTMILPHHNINGEIVGIYERHFAPLRRDVKKEDSEIPYDVLLDYPTAKYLPLPKEGHFAEEDTEKTSWSFPNSKNLYGLHLAKDAIRETGKAIIFEGGKSVMLARQYGYPFAVATHTFGANVNHISMLIECGAKEIILAFDRQYENTDSDNLQWKLYEKKTQELAERVKAYVNVSRIVDYDDHPLLNYKDAPIDQGAEAFRELYERREMLVIDGVSQREQERIRRELSQKEILAKLSKPKATVEEHNAAYDDEAEEQQEEETEFQDLQENTDKTAAPLFHGEPITWLNEPNPAGKGTEHFILWKGEKYKQSAFFEAAYPEQYNKIKKRVKFKNAAAENVFRLSGNQRTILMYRCLASKYPLEKVSELDSFDLQLLCMNERDNTTAAQLASRLRWENGLALLVTFGASLNYTEKQNDSTAAAHTWCYSVEYEADRAIFRGVKMTWEIWSVRLKDILDKCRLHRQSKKAMWESVRPAIYCQDRMRLTLLKEDYFQICDWVNEYFSGYETPFPLHGEIPDADFEFVIDYNADTELVENRSLNSSAAMSEYNRETNAVGNVQKGKEKVLRRFQAAFPDCKPGDQVTTAQLKERGYTDDKAIKRLVDHGIVDRLRRGLYIVKNV